VDSSGRRTLIWKGERPRRSNRSRGNQIEYPIPQGKIHTCQPLIGGEPDSFDVETRRLAKQRYIANLKTMVSQSSWCRNSIGKFFSEIFHKGLETVSLLSDGKTRRVRKVVRQRLVRVLVLMMQNDEVVQEVQLPDYPKKNRNENVRKKKCDPTKM
jgi:hypothetical protein